MNETGPWKNGSEVELELPAILLENPKFPRNVGMTVRLASCYGIKQVWFTGDRMIDELKGLSRVPREERMRGYKEVTLVHGNIDFRKVTGIVPVALEVRENSESLVFFEHPENAIYIFGPEDGSVSKGILHQCHRFLAIPTKHCLNLATAVSTVLYDRKMKMVLSGEADPSIAGTLQEERSWERLHDYGLCEEESD
ncbi:RNA methyltransferase [bacterium]|nr:RNA methyltransferase [bacterium]